MMIRPFTIESSLFIAIVLMSALASAQDVAFLFQDKSQKQGDVQDKEKQAADSKEEMKLAIKDNRVTPAIIKDGTVKLVPENTRIEFVGTHAKNAPRPRLGGFSRFNGSIKLKGEKISNIDIEIDVDSIWTEFAALTKHLKNADFFNTEKFKNSKFSSTSVEYKSETKIHVVGKMSLLGNEKEIEFDAAVKKTDAGIILKSEFDIDRTQFGMDKMTDGVASEVAIAVFVGRKTLGRKPKGPGKNATKKVSLVLPNMCCLGCVAHVGNNLESLDQFKVVTSDLKTKEYSFMVQFDVDVESVLDELAQSNKVFEDWSFDE